MKNHHKDVNDYKPPYPNLSALDHAQNKLRTLPSLVKNTEIRALSSMLANAGRGKSFIIQLGDCAERFAEAGDDITEKKYSHLVQIKNAVEKITGLPVTLIGRIAGQYGKPRSSVLELLGGKPVFSYHGDIVNAEHPTDCRHADPDRMLTAHQSSQKIISYLDAQQQKIFTSHECFLLEYEIAMTRQYQGKFYNTSTHFPWLGMRNIESSQHINYLECIENPIALKVSASISIPLLISVIKKLNPSNKLGRVTLITRLGYTKTKSHMPKLIEAILENKLNVVWMCDPLHGNTHKDQYGMKYRLLDEAIAETRDTLKCLVKMKQHFAGVHIEATYRTDVMECVSSPEELTPERTYQSAVDPRLNYDQSFMYINRLFENISTKELQHNG